MAASRGVVRLLHQWSIMMKEPIRIFGEVESRLPAPRSPILGAMDNGLVNSSQIEQMFPRSSPEGSAVLNPDGTVRISFPVNPSKINGGAEARIGLQISNLVPINKE